MKTNKNTKGMKKAENRNNTETAIDLVAEPIVINGIRKIASLTSEPGEIRAKEFIRSCFFCEEEITEDNKNDSHWIPESFLKRIAKNTGGGNMVCSADPFPALRTSDPSHFFGAKVSPSSASIFFGTCSDCDGPEFREYESSPSAVLTDRSMRQIALKTVIAARYFSLCTMFSSLERIDYAKEKISNSAIASLSKNELEDWVSKNKPFTVDSRIIKNEDSYSSTLLILAKQLKECTKFTKIVDFEIPNKPTIAVHSLFTSSEKFFYVNVFPTDTGSRVLIFVDGSMSRKDYRSVRGVSVMEIVALAMVREKKGMYLSPDLAEIIRDGKELYELLGPKSLHLDQKSLASLSMRKIKDELNFNDSRMDKSLIEFCADQSN